MWGTIIEVSALRPLLLVTSFSFKCGEESLEVDLVLIYVPDLQL